MSEARLDHIGIVVGDLERALRSGATASGSPRRVAAWPAGRILSALNGLDDVELEWAALALGPARSS